MCVRVLVTGMIPRELGDLVALTVLDLHDNSLQGTLRPDVYPPILCQAKSLAFNYMGGGQKGSLAGTPVYSRAIDITIVTYGVQYLQYGLEVSARGTVATCSCGERTARSDGCIFRVYVWTPPCRSNVCRLLENAPFQYFYRAGGLHLRYRRWAH